MLSRALALLLLLAAPAALAQNATLSGYVRDASSGETLLGATVQATPESGGTAQGTVTNTAGFYTLTLPAGRYRIAVSYIGYATKTEVLALAADRRYDVELRPEDEQGDEVEVTGDREAEEENRRIGVTTLPVETIKALPSVLEPDVFRSLQLLPGVKAASDFSSGLYVRGGGPDQTLILLDRTTVYNPTHFFGLFSTFNPDAIKDVRLFKGGYPAEYGGRLGSVLDLYNRDGNDRHLDGTASVGLLASRAMIEGPLPRAEDGRSRGSYMFAARRSTLEPLLAALKNADIDGLPDRFYFYDLNGKVGIAPTANDRVSASFYAGRDDVVLPFLEDATVNLAYGNVTGSAGWTHLFSPRLFSTFTLTASKYYSRPTFNITGTRFESPIDIGDVSVRGDFEYTPSQQHTMKAGFWVGSLDFRLTQRFAGQTGFSPRLGGQYAQAYVQERWTPSPRLSVEGGVRTSYFSDGDHLRFEPRLNAEFRPTERVRVQAGYGRFYQYLSLVSNGAFTAADFWLTTADSVPPSYGDQFVFGVKTNLTRRLNLDIEAYYRTMRDLFEYDPYIPDPAGLPYHKTLRFGDGYAYGLETLLQGQVGRFEGFAGYTFAVTRRRFPDFPLPGQQAYYAPKYDRTHDGNVVATYRLGRGWKATTVFTYGTGQAYSVVTGQFGQRHSPFTSANGTNLVSAFNQGRLPAYHRLDVGFTKEGRFFGFADYELQLQLLNAYSRKNVWFYFYRTDPDTGLLDRVTVNQIPVPLPNIALTLNF